MIVTVLFFGHWRDAAGDSQTVVLPDGATVETLAQQLTHNNPRFASLTRTCRFAVNEEFALLTTRLAENDVVAILPPMSGG